jgi:hypothetical protein
MFLKDGLVFIFSAKPSGLMDPEDEGFKIPRNVSKYSPRNTDHIREYYNRQQILLNVPKCCAVTKFIFREIEGHMMLVNPYDHFNFPNSLLLVAWSCRK